jgi:hypothetical protein
MTASAAKTRSSGRPPCHREDATMRYIAKNELWNAVALQCRITPAAVRAWLRVPPKRVRDVERAIGRPRRLIRPDLFARNVTPTV